jgi:HSP20 family protein
VFADLLESDDAYLLVLDLPGVTSDTVDVTVDRRHISVEARRSKESSDEFRYVRERRDVFLDADVPLPPDATGDGANAQLDRGVLTVELPKRAGDAGRTVPVEDA